jgi:mannose/fructose/N-acetylgalactosamine-specific phosphotransferase system component IID
VPAWTAYNFFTLAEKTGWSLEYMLWNIPMAILNQGTHTYLYESGVRLMRETSTSSSEKQEMASLMGIEI